jgi:hypothetical protein
VDTPQVDARRVVKPLHKLGEPFRHCPLAVRPRVKGIVLWRENDQVLDGRLRAPLKSNRLRAVAF